MSWEVIASLFGDDMAKCFRDLAFERNCASKLMLVVNKMDTDPGAVEDKRPDIELVTSPLEMEDFRTAFVSGEINLEALVENDPGTKASLIDESGIPGLMAGLDAFANDCGLPGALTAPLCGAKSIATQAATIYSADRSEERAAIELLGRRARILRDFRTPARMPGRFSGMARGRCGISSLLNLRIFSMISMEKCSPKRIAWWRRCQVCARSEAVNVPGSERSLMKPLPSLSKSKKPWKHD